MRRMLMVSLGLLLIATAQTGLATVFEKDVTKSVNPAPHASLAERGPVAERDPLLRDGTEDLFGLPVFSGSRWEQDPLDVVGNVIEVGTTYYDLQHNQTAGRTITVDRSGYARFVWTKSDATLASRHIQYNMHAFGSLLLPGGVQVDNSNRAGYATLASDDGGRGIPAYHGFEAAGGSPLATVAKSEFYIGPFEWSQPDTFSDSFGAVTPIWPKTALGQYGFVHLVSTQPNSPDGTLPFYYSRSEPVGSGPVIWQTVDSLDGVPVQFMLVDTTVGVSANVAASRISGRTAMVWNKLLRDPQTGDPLAQVSDLYVQISEDNGLNWGAPINVTNFCKPAADCPDQDWATCNGDTLRAWVDNSVLFDNQDDLHVAFTAVSYHYRDNNGDVVNDVGEPRSAILHWNSGTNEISTIANAFGEWTIPGGWTTAGANHRAVCKPSLSIDTTSTVDPAGELYCSYWRAMPDQWSAEMYPMGDVFVSRSENGGQDWSVGYNVTQTDGGQNAPVGNSLSERDPRLAEVAAREPGGFDWFLYLFYELDHEAGTGILSEGALTNNQLLFQLVPLDSIPTSPLVPPLYVPTHSTATGACQYVNQYGTEACEQKTECECALLSGTYMGDGTPECIVDAPCGIDTVFTETFDSLEDNSLPAGWLQVDVDSGFCTQFNRNSTWRVLSYGAFSHSQPKVLMNNFNDNVLPNDDWVIIPVGSLSGPIMFSYWCATQQLEYPESYELRVSTTGTNPADFSTLLHAEYNVPTTWAKHTFNLTEFAGAPFYIAFHHISIDKFVIKVDDVTLTAGASVPDDHCPGQTIECLPFTASGNNCCATPDWQDCGISTREIFYNYTPSSTTTARLSLCDSPESWNSYISIYEAGENGSCTDSFQVGCLDDGCADPMHVNQLFTFTGGQTYYILVCGYFLEDCGEYVFNMTDETDYSQPDTLYYDNEEAFAAYIDSVWARVRFTPPSNFTLRNAYLKTVWGNEADGPCEFKVYVTPPGPGVAIAEATACVPNSFGWGDPQWVSATLDNPWTMNAGADFWVVAGPQSHGAPGPVSGWKALLATSSSGRSTQSSTGLYGPYIAASADFMLRVGGELALGSPDSLVIEPAANGADIELYWGSVSGASEYSIYRSTSPITTPVPEDLIGTSLTPDYVDAGVLVGGDQQVYYVVTATQSAWLSSNGETGPLKSEGSRASEVIHRPMQVKAR
ncbi:MAG: choice-of-anchor J domain-containing protein [Calditrichaeota bacterium]|nr:choice-of-anchor J domain-containing protein [Calditrichota bacterium]MCB9391755.1 choice-of-anchor J domain-containing protein [Calditrichota bacterium]